MAIIRNAAQLKNTLSATHKRLLFTLVALLTVPAAIILIIPSAQTKPAHAFNAPASLPIVSITQATATEHQATIQAYGEVTPTYQVQIASEVTGKVRSLDPAFASGQILKNGTLLVSVEDSSYQTNYLTAQKALADAEITLLQEQRTRVQAKQEWLRSGLTGQPDSPLVLNAPQVKAAHLAVQQQQAAVAQAKQDLEHTQIRTPFDALVVKRSVSTGSYLQAGSKLGTLYSANDIEIRLLLSDAQWQLLPKSPEQLGTLEVLLTDEQNPSTQWHAYIKRVEQHFESETRQRAVILSVENPLQQGLLPGLFVQAKIGGKKLQQVLRLPASALSLQGEIWFVDEQSLLQKFRATPRFDDQGEMLIQAPPGMSSLAVVVQPMASYQPAMKVDARPEDPLISTEQSNMAQTKLTEAATDVL